MEEGENVLSKEVIGQKPSAVKAPVQKSMQPEEEGKMDGKEKHSESEWTPGRPIKVREPVQ